MGAFFAVVTTLGVGVIIASIIYQVLTHPGGSKPVLNFVQGTTTGVTNTLFK